MKYHYLNCVLCVAGFMVAGTVGGKDNVATPSPEEMMKKMETAGAPGGAHKALEPLVGDWDVEVKSWMAPDAPPVITKGTAKAAWTMKGRFVQEEFNGEMMGKPFRGLSLTGYDNQKRQYSNFWIDDMHTSMVMSEGEAQSNGKVITLNGKMDCPITGEKDKVIKQVVRIIDSNKRILEMQDPGQGDKKTMEITYTRK